MTKKIAILCTAFRDGFQSVYGSRILSKDFLPIVKETKKAGISRFESGGGATFQSAFFYLNENAFDVMDAFRTAVGPDAYLQTLARGVNVVGLDSQSSDIIKLHAQLFKKHGVTAIRNFDALNDPENLAYSGQCIVEAGLKHQIAIAMMSLPPGNIGAHDADFYEQTLRKIIKADIPFHSIAFKDASGTAFPSLVYETIKRARAILGQDVPIEFHSHETAGAGLACYLSAIEAGADIVDLSMAPVSGGTCQPDIATLWHALRGTSYELDVDVDAVMRVEEDFKEALSAYFLPPEALHVEPMIPWSPMPGGALTSNTQMLRDSGIMNKYAEIIKAMEEVVCKGGYGTSVTPVSQFYFQQAFNNVMNGPWQKIADGYGKMVLGYFGKTPVAPDEEVVKMASEQLGLPPTTESPRLINDRNPQKGVAAATGMLRENSLSITDENIFIAATCGQKGIDFLKGNGKVSVRYKKQPSAEKKEYTIVVDGKSFDVHLDEGKVRVDGHSYAFSVEKEKASVQPVRKGKGHEITSPIMGTLTAVLVKEGQEVKTGQPLFTIEVMKMESEIKSPFDGIIGEILVTKGMQITQGQLLARSA